MNIAFVNATRRFGGVKAWTLDLASRLTEKGHHAPIFCRRGPFHTRAVKLGLEAHAMNFGFDYNPLAVWRFYRYFKQHNIDALVVNVGKDIRTAGVAARLAGIPVIHRVGLPRDMSNTPKVKNTHKFIGPQILVPCQFIKDGLLKELDFLHPEEVTVILTGKKSSAEPPSLVRSPRQIAVTSQLNPDKGHADLLHALKRLKDGGYSFHLHVAGTGKSEKELKQLAHELGLTDNITWHGFVQDIRSILKQADIFVLPSYSEGLPNTLLEAMSEGLVPVARNIGGIAEAWPFDISPLEKTLVKRERVPDHLVHALEELLRLDNEALFQLRDDVWNWFRANNSLDVRADEFIAFIREQCRR